MAIIGYVVAFVHSDRGTVHYNRYVEAAVSCHNHVINSGAAQLDCNMVPNVREQLIEHRQAIAVGEPFMNLAISLTLVIIVSPLLRGLVFWLMGSTPVFRTRAVVRVTR